VLSLYVHFYYLWIYIRKCNCFCITQGQNQARKQLTRSWIPWMMTSSACLITSHRRSHSQSGIVKAEMNAIPIECHTVGLILLMTTETPTLRKMLHSLVLPTQKQFQTVEGTWFPANGTTCLASVNYNCFCTKNRMFFRERKLQIESIHEENGTGHCWSVMEFHLLVANYSYGAFVVLSLKYKMIDWFCWSFLL